VYTPSASVDDGALPLEQLGFPPLLGVESLPLPGLNIIQVVLQHPVHMRPSLTATNPSQIVCDSGIRNASKEKAVLSQRLPI
jgi:hypothetical protein